MIYISNNIFLGRGEGWTWIIKKLNGWGKKIGGHLFPSNPSISPSPLAFPDIIISLNFFSYQILFLISLIFISNFYNILMFFIQNTKHNFFHEKLSLKWIDLAILLSNLWAKIRRFDLFSIFKNLLKTKEKLSMMFGLILE